MVTGGFRTRGGMEQALAGGPVDVIGLGRPLCTDPDVPKRLLAGVDAGGSLSLCDASSQQRLSQ